MVKLLVTTLAGPADPTRASVPFHLATNGAAKNGIETAICLIADATELLKPGVAETVRGIGVPPLAELFASCKANGIRFYV